MIQELDNLNSGSSRYRLILIKLGISWIQRIWRNLCNMERSCGIEEMAFTATVINISNAECILTTAKRLI